MLIFGSVQMNDPYQLFLDGWMVRVQADSSASLSNSITVKVIDHPAKKSQLSWWNRHNKDRTPSTSGVLRYLTSMSRKLHKTSQLFSGRELLVQCLKLLCLLGLLPLRFSLQIQNKGRKNSKQRYLCLVGFITGVW